MKKALKKTAKPKKAESKKQIKQQEQGIAVLPVIIMAASVIAFAVMGYFVYKHMYPAKTATNTNSVACTQDAKLCPDGSYVGRSGPNCEFTACPGTPISAADLQYLKSYQVSPGSSDVWMAWRYTSSRTEGSTVIRTYQPDHLLVGFTSNTYETLFFRDDGYLATHDDVHGGARNAWVGTWAFDDTSDTLTLSYKDGTAQLYRIVTLRDRLLELTPIIQVGPGDAIETEADTGLRITVKLGPTCPVIQVNDPGSCADKPYQHEIEILSSARTLIKRVTSDTEGKATVLITPGTYILTAEKNTSAVSYPLPPEETVTVKAHEMTDVILTFDTGIR